MAVGVAAATTMFSGRGHEIMPNKFGQSMLCAMEKPGDLLRNKNACRLSFSCMECVFVCDVNDPIHWAGKLMNRHCQAIMDGRCYLVHSTLLITLLFILNAQPKPIFGYNIPILLWIERAYCLSTQLTLSGWLAGSFMVLRCVGAGFECGAENSRRQHFILVSYLANSNARKSIIILITTITMKWCVDDDGLVLTTSDNVAGDCWEVYLGKHHAYSYIPHTYYYYYHLWKGQTQNGSLMTLGNTICGWDMRWCRCKR